jgi:hypothetical protein
MFTTNKGEKVLLSDLATVFAPIAITVICIVSWKNVIRFVGLISNRIVQHTFIFNKPKNWNVVLRYPLGPFSSIVTGTANAMLYEEKIFMKFSKNESGSAGILYKE